MVQAVLPARPLAERLFYNILAKATRHPLFLEELAWAVREHSDLRLPRRSPTTVQAVLAARIDGLPPGGKQLVQTAAVIGPRSAKAFASGNCRNGRGRAAARAAAAAGGRVPV